VAFAVRAPVMLMASAWPLPLICKPVICLQKHSVGRQAAAAVIGDRVVGEASELLLWASLTSIPPDELPVMESLADRHALRAVLQEDPAPWLSAIVSPVRVSRGACTERPLWLSWTFEPVSVKLAQEVGQLP